MSNISSHHAIKARLGLAALSTQFLCRNPQGFAAVSPAVVWVVQVAPLNAAQISGQLDFIQIEPVDQTSGLDVVEGQHRQMIAIGLFSKGKHVKLPASF